MPWSLLSSTPSNGEVFHCILQRECKAINSGGPGSTIGLRLLQTLIRHYYSGNLKKTSVKCLLHCCCCAITVVWCMGCLLHHANSYYTVASLDGTNPRLPYLVLPPPRVALTSGKPHALHCSPPAFHAVIAWAPWLTHPWLRGVL